MTEEDEKTHDEMSMRQGELFMGKIVDAIDAANIEIQDRGEVPVLSAVLSALTSALAHHLAGISNPEHRMALYGRCGEALVDQIQSSIDTGNTADIIERDQEQLQ